MAKAKEAKAKNSKSAKTSVKTYHNFIGGEWVKSSSGEWFTNENPADTTDIVGRFPLSNKEDVDRAVAAAKGAADKWRRTPAPRRAELLFRLGEILRANKDRYTQDMTREMGKITKEAGGDVQEAIDCTYYTAGEGRRLHGFTTPLGIPACSQALTRFNADKGTSSPDLMMTVLPHTSAGINFHDGIAIGKLNGVIRPQTPTGWRTHIANLFGISAGVVKP